MKLLRKSLLLLVVLAGFILSTKEYDFADLKHVIPKEKATKTRQDFIQKIRKNMINGKENIVLTYRGDYNDIKDVIENPIDVVCSIDDKKTSSDYDYLKYSFKSLVVNVHGTNMLGNLANSLNTFNITYQMKYRETKKQTELVDQKVKDIFKKNKILKKTDYEKVKFVHDYIIKNASYDLNYSKDTAYHNLIEKSSICQGYAALAYKMMTEAGIPCRIIEGKGDGEPHAWNIVKLDGKWYNIDLTWDDPISADGRSILQYNYFLKSEKDFKDHIRNKTYKTAWFMKKYKIAEQSFSIK